MPRDSTHQMVLSGVLYTRIPPETSAVLVDLVAADDETNGRADLAEPDLLAHYPTFVAKFVQVAVDDGRYVSLQVVRQGPRTIPLKSYGDAVRELANLGSLDGNPAPYPITLWILPRQSAILEQEAAERRARGEDYPALVAADGVSVTIHGSALTTTSLENVITTVRRWIDRAAGIIGTQVEWREDV